eukprot:11213401-Lingulodinium_polyedra.AAC.1
MGLTDVGPPHSLRHSRPALEVASGTKTLEEVRRRGRWVSLKSVQRYTKAFHLVKARALVPPGLRERGMQLLGDPAKEFAALLEKLGPRSVQERAVLEAVRSFEAAGSTKAPRRRCAALPEPAADGAEAELAWSCGEEVRETHPLPRPRRRGSAAASGARSGQTLRGADAAHRNRARAQQA